MKKKRGNANKPLEVRVVNFETEISNLFDRVAANKFFQQEAEDIRMQFLKENKGNTAQYDKFLKLYNQLKERINGMDNMAENLKNYRDNRRKK